MADKDIEIKKKNQSNLEPNADVQKQTDAIINISRTGETKSKSDIKTEPNSNIQSTDTADGVEKLAESSDQTAVGPQDIQPIQQSPQNPNNDNEQEEEEEEEEKEKEEEKKEDKDKKDKEEKEEPEKQEPKEESEEGTKKPEEEPKNLDEEQGPKHPRNNQEAAENAVKDNQPIGIAGKDTAKEGGKNLAKQGVKAGEKAGKEGAKRLSKQAIKEAVRAAGQTIKSLLVEAVEALVAAFGWPVLVVIAAICLIVIIIFALLACSAYGGEFGKTYPNRAGKDDKNVQELLEAAKTPATGITSGNFHRFDFLNAEDKKYVEDGLIDKRAAAALNYLQKLHKRIAVSHIISAYKDMPNNPEADSQLSSNVSAHKEGLAADVTEIDFVYKTLEPNASCSQGAGIGGLGGLVGIGGVLGAQGISDIVYYGDDMGTVTTSSQNTNAQDLTSTIDETQASLISNLNELSNTISSVQNTVSSNRDTLKNKLSDNQGDLTELEDNANAAKTNIENLKNKTNATVNQLKNLNNNLQNISNSLAGSSDQAKAQDLQGKIATAQKSIDTALQKLNSTSNIISGINTRVINDHSNLQDYLISNNTTSTLDVIIKTLNVDMITVRALNNVAVIQGLDTLTNTVSAVINSFNDLNNFLQNNTFGAWDQISGSLGDSLGTFGGLLGGGSGGTTELLRLMCEGTELTVSNPDTTIGAFPAQAIPIKVAWQDSKPGVSHTDDIADEAGSVDPRVYYSVYQPEARFKVHQLISQLLQMPYDLGSQSEYKVTQIITFSEERDVVPFKDILDKLYGKTRKPNYGLFSMPEAWGQVHIGY